MISVFLLGTILCGLRAIIEIPHIAIICVTSEGCKTPTLVMLLTRLAASTKSLLLLEKEIVAS